MTQANYEELDGFRGYGIQQMTKPIDADQEQFDKIEFIAGHPRTGQDVARAATLKELKEKTSALPQCYVPVGDHLMELTHELTGEREIIVNFFKPNGDAVLTVAKLPRDSTNADIDAILPKGCELDTAELAEVLQLVRTPPTRAK